MRAWVTTVEPGGIRMLDRAEPVPGPGEVLVRVSACGLCRTDLHVIDHELPVHHPGVVPGHQVVGAVTRTGPGVATLRAGDTVGVAWLRETCGQCRWCREGRENLCPAARFTGWDADGGFAEYLVAPAAFVYPLPVDVEAELLAPLLCAGIIGYRALLRANLPAGGHLGIYGFGSSAHITAQLARAGGAEFSAMSRSGADRDLALRFGAVFAGGADEAPPRPLDAAIVFAPAGELVPPALEATARGGTVVLAGIHMSDIPAMSYSDHVFFERDLRTVTANTRADGAAFLRLAQHLDLRPHVTAWPAEHLPDAIDALRSGAAAGSHVIRF